MHATDLTELGRNPSAALRRAKDQPVLILGGDQPAALLIHLDPSALDAEAVRPALAADVYKNGCVSLGLAAKISGMPLGDFITHLGDLGVEIVGPDETTDGEVSDASPWLSS